MATHNYYAVVKGNVVKFHHYWDTTLFTEAVTKNDGTFCPKARPNAVCDCGNGVEIFPLEDGTRPTLTPGDYILNPTYTVNEDRTKVIKGWDVGTTSLEKYKADFKKQLGALRYEIETSGVDMGSTVIDSSRDSQSMINSAYTKLTRKVADLVAAGTEEAEARTTNLIQFKAETGWAEMSLASIEAIVDIVGDYVQACFTREGEISALIDAAETHQDVQDISKTEFKTGWPKESFNTYEA